MSHPPVRSTRPFLPLLLLLFLPGLPACEAPPTGPAEGSLNPAPPRLGTTVPGHGTDHSRIDGDGNGFPDEGVTVNGHYTALFAWDASGDWYFDLGDGRVRGTVSSVEELDGETLTVCDYVVNYRGNFENDPFLDSGWIQNHINCSGFADEGKYQFLIVHETDPRYRGIDEHSIWNTWEYHVKTRSGSGNVLRTDNTKVRPESHVGG